MSAKFQRYLAYVNQHGAVPETHEGAILRLDAAVEDYERSFNEHVASRRAMGNARAYEEAHDMLVGLKSALAFLQGNEGATLRDWDLARQGAAIGL